MVTPSNVKLGLDFDNTLIHYDPLFHALAVERELISPDTEADKIVIRNLLRAKGQDENFTLLQAEVYGSQIREAKACPGMTNALSLIQNMGIELVIVSHKTATPYKGPPYDLHGAAIDWLEQQGFFLHDGLGWDKKQVFFEPTKEMKVQRIQSLGCTHYVDDLPEILSMLPDLMCRVHYAPSGLSSWVGGPRIKDWSELVSLFGDGDYAQ